MIRSSKPKRQRFFRFNAPLHVRQHFLHSHIDKQLRKRLSIKRSAVQISKGDTVKVMAGKNKGKSGKVIRVNLRTGKVSIDTFTKKNAKGKEFNIPISASSVYITELNLNDKVRAAKLNVARVVSKPEVKEAKIEKKPEEETKEAKPVQQHAPHTMSETLKK
ncbi:MAG: 50S ribosomal protein L24 [Candidatus Micrarchaeota archaeon]|nr:50S ribosomal protein L24 [Candidatus Micrarchaeota archaeon]